eukprot:gene18925-38057_t
MIHRVVSSMFALTGSSTLSRNGVGASAGTTTDVAPGAMLMAVGAVVVVAVGRHEFFSGQAMDQNVVQFRIGEAAQQSGVSAANIRYYEKEGLLPPGARGDNSYRLYSGADVHQLRFIRLCRAMDMSLDEVRTLLALDLRKKEDIEAAYDIALAEGSEVIVERFVLGEEHRLLVVGYRLVAASRGETASVTGDGQHSVRDLVEMQINSDPRRGSDGTSLLTMRCARPSTMAVLPNSWASTVANAPEKEPIGVRAAETITMSEDEVLICVCLSQKGWRQSQTRPRQDSFVFVQPSVKGPDLSNSDDGLGNRPFSRVVFARCVSHLPNCLASAKNSGETIQYRAIRSEREPNLADSKQANPV